MQLNKALSKRIREVLLDGHWIANTNYREQIQSVTWQQATTKIDNLNTIALLTFHVNYYLSGLQRAFETGKLDISDKYSLDMPPLNTESDWNALVEEFLSNAKDFANTVEEIEDALFDKPFFDDKYGTYLRNIEGVIEHSYYHLGQISLLKKLIIQKESDASKS